MTDKVQINQFQEKEETIDYREVFRKILNKWYLFIIFTIIGISGAYTINKIILPTYEARATLYAPNNRENVDMANIFNATGYGTPTNIQNHIGILSSYTLIRQAIENLDWRVTWYENFVITKVDLYKYSPFKIESFNPLLNLPGVNVKLIPINNDRCVFSVNELLKIEGIEKRIVFEENYTYGDTLKNEYFNFVMNRVPGRSIDPDKEYSFTFNDFDYLARIYRGILEVSLVNLEADLIQLKIVGTQPEREADFLNELTRVFIDFGLKEKNKESENTVNFIDAQLTGIVDSLQSTGRSFTNFRSRNRIVDLSQEAGLIVERLEQLESEESLAQMRLEYYQNLLSYLGDADIMEQVIAPSVVGITDPALNSMVISLGELYNRRSTLSFSVQEKNPSLLALENEIRYMRQSLEENLKNLISNAEIQLGNTTESKNQLMGELAQMPQTEQALGNIKRQFDLNNELYTFLLQKRAEAAITKASNVPDVQIIDFARFENSVLLGPNSILNYIIGILIGFFIPVVIVFSMHFLDKTIKSKEDIERLVAIPVMSEIGHEKKGDYMPILNNPYSGISESFRIVRTKIDNLFGKNMKKIIAIHSIIPGEGKTFFAINLASIFAHNNKKVLLICADLRKPKIHLLYNIPNDIGLSSYLIDKNNIDDIVFSSKVKNLTIIPSGPAPPNPAELLGNGQMEKLISKSKEYFDYVIIDNAPSGLVADAVIVGEYADMNLFVVRSDFTNKDQLKIIEHHRALDTIKNISIILNDVAVSRSEYHIYYKKGYGSFSDIKKKNKREDKLAKV